MMKPDSKYHQTGMTTVGMALILAVVIFISTVVIKLVPVYLEHFNVTSVLNAVKEDPELGGMTDQDIRKTLTNRFTINDINGVEAKQVKMLNPCPWTTKNASTCFGTSMPWFTLMRMPR